MEIRYITLSQDNKEYHAMLHMYDGYGSLKKETFYEGTCYNTAFRFAVRLAAIFAVELMIEGVLTKKN